jgi:hypothetical protein
MIQYNTLFPIRKESGQWAKARKFSNFFRQKRGFFKKIWYIYYRALFGAAHTPWKEDHTVQFTQQFLDELTARNDIADVVSSYVTLTPKGGNLFGLCPFHNEKTASFSVNTGKQIYHCFGCHKGGGVINFIMEIENLSFPEAVEFLAKRAGMELPQSDRRDEGAERQRKRLLQLNKEAARWYYEVLVSDEDKLYGSIWTSGASPKRWLSTSVWVLHPTRGIGCCRR